MTSSTVVVEIYLIIEVKEIKADKLKKKPRYIEACFNIYLEVILVDDDFHNLRKASISSLKILKAILKMLLFNI